VAERSSDLRADVAVLRRRWRIIAAAVVLGVALGVLYAHLVPAQLTSRSLVLLSNGGSSGGGSGDTGVDTQVQIVLSTPVLAQAGRAVHPALSATEVLKRVDVQPATSQLLRIDTSSPQAKDAQALSQAVAEAYVQRATDNLRSVTGAIVAELRTRRNALDQQVKALQTQIDATSARLSGEDRTSPVGVRDAQLLAQLQGEQADIAKQLDGVKGDLAASGAVGTASTLASIVQPAAPATGPDPLFRLVTAGLVGGLLLGVLAAALVALRARRDPRLRARDDIADAVGSTVLVDLRSRPQRSVAEWSTLFETYDAPPVDAWAFRQMLRALVTSLDPARVGRTQTSRGGRLEHPHSVTVIALAGDRRGLAVAPQLATFAASLGIRTRLVVATGQDLAASLWAACSSERASELRAGLQFESRSADPVVTRAPLGPDGALSEPVLPQSLAGNTDALVKIRDALVEIMKAIPGSAPDADDQDDEKPAANAMSRVTPLPDVLTAFTAAPKHPAPDLTVVLAVVDGKQPKLNAVAPTAATVLAVAPGVGTREDLARLAVAVDDAGRRIDGIVVADPDPSDRTTGRRTLDERSRQAPLPLRVTGISSSSVAASERGTGR
jgi:capsular polysaccharide biosynthesis protein